jgi:cholesterol oxidase
MAAVRVPGSLSLFPYVEGKNMAVRLFADRMGEIFRHPRAWWKYAVGARLGPKKTTILLFMQTLDSTVTFTRRRFGGMRTTVVGEDKPTAFIPRATELARKMEKILERKSHGVFPHAPWPAYPARPTSSAGRSWAIHRKTGVIDRNNRVFGYENMLVCDGAMSFRPIRV